MLAIIITPFTDCTLNHFPGIESGNEGTQIFAKIRNIFHEQLFNIDAFLLRLEFRECQTLALGRRSNLKRN